MLPLTVNNLKGFVPFHIFSDARLKFLLDHCHRLFLRKGQILQGPGQANGDAYYLMSGRIFAENDQLEIGALTGYPLHYLCDKKDTLMAVTDCSLFRVNKELLDRFVCWSEAAVYLEDDIALQQHSSDQFEWIQTLLSSNLFYKVSPLRMEEVFSHLTTIDVKAGSCIVKQGDLGDCCYFIKEGKAVVTREEKKGEEAVELARIGVGRCFGEDALIHEAARNATVTMETEGVLMRMEKRDFLQLLKDPDVNSLSYSELELRIEAGSILLDVRSAEEYAFSHLDGAVSAPLGGLRLHSRVFGTYENYVVCCDTGRRSRAAAYFLAQQGFHVHALNGGLNLLPESKKLRLVGH